MQQQDYPYKTGAHTCPGTRAKTMSHCNVQCNCMRVQEIRLHVLFIPQLATALQYTATATEEFSRLHGNAMIAYSKK